MAKSRASTPRPHERTWAGCGGQKVSLSAATVSLRITPSTKGTWATGLICCIVTARRHSFCKLCERLHHSECPRDNIGLNPAYAKILTHGHYPLNLGPYGHSARYDRRDGQA